MTCEELRALFHKVYYVGPLEEWLARHHYTGRSSNGRTADSKPANTGSNPVLSANPPKEIKPL